MYIPESQTVQGAFVNHRFDSCCVRKTGGFLRALGVHGFLLSISHGEKLLSLNLQYWVGSSLQPLIHDRTPLLRPPTTLEYTLNGSIKRPLGGSWFNRIMTGYQIIAVLEEEGLLISGNGDARRKMAHTPKPTSLLT